MNESIAHIQRKLAGAGHDPGPIDGVWGQRSERALDDALRAHTLAAAPTQSLAWGARVSAMFRAKAIAICDRLGMNADYLMACIAWESAETFSPKIRNAAGSGAVGLIQFMPTTAAAMGVTVEALAMMTAEMQLDYVEEYFKPYRNRLHTLSDHYMAILWPAAIGKPEDAILWDRTVKPTTYRQNAGLDFNKDGYITKGEAAAKVKEKLDRGMLPQNRWIA